MRRVDWDLKFMSFYQCSSLKMRFFSRRRMFCRRGWWSFECYITLSLRFDIWHCWIVCPALLYLCRCLVWKSQPIFQNNTQWWYFPPITFMICSIFSPQYWRILSGCIVCLTATWFWYKLYVPHQINWNCLGDHLTFRPTLASIQNCNLSKTLLYDQLRTFPSASATLWVSR